MADTGHSAGKGLGAGERIAQAIDAARNEHWQQHLQDHPLSNATSCPYDYGMHDAYARAARIAREATR